MYCLKYKKGVNKFFKNIMKIKSIHFSNQKLLNFKIKSSD